MFLVLWMESILQFNVIGSGVYFITTTKELTPLYLLGLLVMIMNSVSDAMVFNNVELKDVIENQNVGFPKAEPHPCDDKDLSYFFVGDDAFHNRTWLIKPISRRDLNNKERIFNYKLSRTRRVGILANRWK